MSAPKVTPAAGSNSSAALQASYAFCERVARRQAKNFYYSFLLLPRAQRQAMCAIYAFMRYCDDLSDDETIRDRAAEIARWRQDLEAALERTADAREDGRCSAHPVWPAFSDAVARYRIPHQYFFDMIEGVSSDLEPRRIATFNELYDYCYHVASVVGLTIIHIFGFDAPEAQSQASALAEKCGIAFQLTNILRDVREDSEKDRVYLPQEDLARFGVEARSLTNGTASASLRPVLEFEAERAREFYRAAEELLPLVDEESQPALWTLVEIYRRLLKRIAARNYDVLSERVRLSTAEKLVVLSKGFWKRLT
jgi:15-cis-phytoene synthase